MYKKLGILVYTNETNLPILELFLKYFFKYNPTFSYPIYIVSNRFTNTTLPHQDKVTYLDGNVEWNSQGRHFSQTINMGQQSY
jgi:deoxyadenosine/deoxycytidine kinase